MSDGPKSTDVAGQATTNSGGPGLPGTVSPGSAQEVQQFTNMPSTANGSSNNPGITAAGRILAPTLGLDEYVAGSQPHFHLENNPKVKTLQDLLGSGIDDKEQFIRLKEFHHKTTSTSNEDTSQDVKDGTNVDINEDKYCVSFNMGDMKMGNILFAIPFNPHEIIHMMYPNLSFYTMSMYRKYWPVADFFLTCHSANVKLNLVATVFKHKTYNALKATTALDRKRGESLRILQSTSGTQRTLINTDGTETYSFNCTMPNTKMANPYTAMMSKKDTEKFESDWLVVYVAHDLMGTLGLLRPEDPVCQFTASAKINRSLTEVSQPTTLDEQREYFETELKTLWGNNGPSKNQHTKDGDTESGLKPESKDETEKDNTSGTSPAPEAVVQTSTAESNAAIKTILSDAGTATSLSSFAPRTQSRSANFLPFRETKKDRNTGEILVDTVHTFPQEEWKEMYKTDLRCTTSRRKVIWHKNYIEGTAPLDTSSELPHCFEVKVVIDMDRNPELKQIPAIGTSSQSIQGLGITATAINGQKVSSCQHATTFTFDESPTHRLGGIKEFDSLKNPGTLDRVARITTHKGKMYMRFLMPGAKDDFTRGHITLAINAKLDVLNSTDANTAERILARKRYRDTIINDHDSDKIVFNVFGAPVDEFNRAIWLVTHGNDTEKAQGRAILNTYSYEPQVSNTSDTTKKYAQVPGIYDDSVDADDYGYFVETLDDGNTSVDTCTIVPNLAKVKSLKEYNSILSRSNNAESSTAKRSKTSPFDDPNRTTNGKMYTKKAYNKRKAKMTFEGRIVVTEIIEGIVAVVSLLIAAIKQKRGQEEFISNLVHEENLLAEERCVIGGSHFYNVIDNEDGTNIHKTMSLDAFMAEYLQATGSYLSHDEVAEVLYERSHAASYLYRLLTTTDIKVTAMKRSVVRADAFSFLSDPQYATYLDAHLGVAQELANQPAAIFYEACVLFGMELFELGPYGLDINRLKVKRDRAYENLRAAGVIDQITYNAAMDKILKIVYWEGRPAHAIETFDDVLGFAELL